MSTNVLRLGINVADIRLVLHIGELFDLTNYGQESRCVGHDGRRLEAIVLVAEGDVQNRYKDTDEQLL